MSKLIDKLMARDEHVCPWWMAWTFDNPLRKWFQNPDRILGSFVREGMTVADIGCGMGYFSVAMARMVGPSGRVQSVDLQEKMLQYLKKRAVKVGVQDRITTILAEPDDIKTTAKVDLVLVFWMVHEVKDIPRFFGQVAAILKPGGKVLYVEPRMHVTQERFEEIVGYAKTAGFSVDDSPKIGMSRSAVLKGDDRGI
jgi:ubiquinone/menaquinone biosynthesis C-methylase UbiE